MSLDLIEMKSWSVRMTFKKKSKGNCDWSPERLQETQLEALGVPSRGFIYCYNVTNVRKCDDSYDKAVHTNDTTTRHHDSRTTSLRVIPCHHESYYVTSDITAPRTPVWPPSYVSVGHVLCRQYGRCHWVYRTFYSKATQNTPIVWNLWIWVTTSK